MAVFPFILFNYISSNLVRVNVDNILVQRSERQFSV